MGEIPGHDPERGKKKTVIENSVIEKSEIPGSIEIKGKVIIDGKEVKENYPEAQNAKELLSRLKKVKEGDFDDKTESPCREVEIPTVKELMDKGIDEETAKRMVRERIEDEQDFQEALSGIEILKQMKKAKSETKEVSNCSRCGEEINLDDKFCGKCGNKL